MATSAQFMSEPTRSCRGRDPNLFFPPDENVSAWHTAAAKKICNGCSVQLACLKYALENDIRYGVWGGTTAYERLPAKRRKGKKP